MLQVVDEVKMKFATHQVHTFVFLSPREREKYVLGSKAGSLMIDDSPIGIKN